MSVPIITDLYCVMCFAVTNNVCVNDFWVIGKVCLHLHCNNCGFRKERVDLLRDMGYTPKQHKIKPDYFLEGYLEEELNEDELNKNYFNRYEKEIEERKSDNIYELDLSKT